MMYICEIGFKDELCGQTAQYVHRSDERYICGCHALDFPNHEIERLTCRECGASEELAYTGLFTPPLCSKCRAYSLEEDLIDTATTKLPELRKALHELADAVIQDVDIKDRSQRLQEAMLNAVSTLAKVAK